MNNEKASDALQNEIRHMVGLEYSKRAIARHLGISDSTVRKYAGKPVSKTGQKPSVSGTRPSLEKPKLAIFAPDLHWPKINWPTWKALSAFIAENPISLFVFGGDQADNQECSHHTKGKNRLRADLQLKKNRLSFDKEILTPLEALLPSDCKKVWIEGNHCAWIKQYIDENPELEGELEWEINLNLAKRGWEFIECGKSFRYGKLTYIHGETLKGQNHSKTAVDTYCRSVLYGHYHTLQTTTKVMPYDQTQKFTATCSPILGATNPHYLRNGSTSWVSGFTLVEYRDGGHFNLYPVVCVNGVFSFGGKIYRG